MSNMPRLHARPRVDLHRFLALLCLMLGGLICLPASAAIRDVEPGTVPTLAADEALLAIGVDSNVDLDAVRLLREGGSAEMKTLRGLAKGRQLRLMVVPVGRYRWSSLELREQSHNLTLEVKDEDATFDVRPGRINYPGDIIFRNVDVWSASLHFANRGLGVIDWLQARYRAVHDAHPFEFTGRYPDPFPAFYRTETAGQPPVADSSLPAPTPGPLPIAVDTLWRPGHLDRIELNAAGDLVAEVLTVTRDGKQLWAIDLLDLSTDKTVHLTESPKPVTRVDWVDDRLLALSIGNIDEPDTLIAVDIRDTPSGRAYRLAVVPRAGQLVSVLHDRPGSILFQSAIENRLTGPVHVLDLRDHEALRKFRFADRDRVDRGLEGVLRWHADRAGRLRLAVVSDEEGQPVFMHGIDGTYRKVVDLTDGGFSPLALSADGERIYGTTGHGRSQRDLVELDPNSGRIVRTVHSIPGIDIEAPLFGRDGTLIGVTHYRDGLLVSDYFSQTETEVERGVATAFPDRATILLQRDAKARRFVVAVGGSDLPIAVHLYDRDSAKARLLVESQPWLSGLRFAPSHTLRTKSRDGLDIEAYLTLPAGTGKRPLIVFPHGGPIGIRDDRLFDPEVQFLASLGYAVLQVNFRGSEGFGTAFRGAGFRSYGSAIEDDIDAALTAALAQYPLDAQRMCAMGSSYGGYSALVSAIRWPGRFRCAISIAGVSDRALFFTASDSARTAESRESMERAIGNPHTDMDELRRYSPLYRYRELTLPVMLVHGGEDVRVDYEHARRLHRMLNLAGRPPVLIEMQGEAHGIQGDANRKRTWEAIAGFLRQHLGENAPAR